MTETERIVIVGTGVAGLRAAERLRELNFDGELVMVSEEPYRPYHRPALNKQLIMGAVRPRDIVLPVHTDLDAIWRYATRAVRLDAEEHVLHLPGGEEMRYDGLVIATGVQARHLPGAPRHDPRVQVLRTIGDAVAVQRAIAHSKGAVAVIGGGFVGCELASAAREMGRDATIILRDLELLDKVPGPAVSEMVTALHRAHGVQLITQAAVKHWVPTADGMALHLSTGQVVVASVVVLGVGAVPAVDWLRGSGLILDDGVMCDPTCHAIGAEDIVVAGDVARWPNLRFDTMPRRIEHWLNAIEMGRAAAENLLTGKTNAEPFTPVPRFWSDQHGIRIQAAGIPVLAQDTVPLGGSVMVSHRVTGYVSDGSLVGVVAWDSPRGMLRWTSELDRQSTEAMRRRLAARPVTAERSLTEPPRPLPRVVPPPMPVLNPDLEHTSVLSTPLREPFMAMPPDSPPLRPTNGRSFEPIPPSGRTNGHSFEPAPPGRSNGHSFEPAPPMRSNGHSFDSPPLPRSNGHRVEPAPPMRSNGHLVEPAPPMRSNGQSFGPPPRQTNGRSFDSAPPRQSNGRSFGPPPPRQTNGHGFEPDPLRHNGHSFESAPLGQPNGRAVDSGPLRQSNGHSFGPPPPGQSNGHSFEPAPPRQSNGHSFEPAPPRQSNGHSFEPAPPRQSNGHSFGPPPPSRPISSDEVESTQVRPLPPRRANGRSREPMPPSRQPNGQSFEHPSFPSMPPVPPPPRNGRPVEPMPPDSPPLRPHNGHSFDTTPPRWNNVHSFEHPSFPSMPPVRPPAPAVSGEFDHPSFPSMPPVSPPPRNNGRSFEHPSFPSMPPVPPPNNGRSFDHPSFPSMPPVPPPNGRLNELFERDAGMPGMHVPDLRPIDLRTVIR